MPTPKNTSNILLLLGDVLLFSASLYITLVVRYGSLPDPELLEVHFTAFSVLFIIWVFIFFVAGLYDKQTLLFPESLWQRILKTQLVNSFVAVVFFYAIPFFAIAPKTNLFIYLVISFAFILLWRYWASTLLSTRQPSQAVMIASGAEADTLVERINQYRYGLRIAARIEPQIGSADDLYQAVKEAVAENNATYIVIDTQDEVVQSVLSRLYSLLYVNVYFITVDSLYETVFERVPVGRLKHEWFIEHIRRTPHAAYDTLKNGMDVVAAGLLFLLSLPLYPCIAALIWLDDHGPVFYRQRRIGQFGKTIRITKFRTMTEGSEDKQVTRVGWWLRKTRIDELPQLFNVLEGKLSLIGPRPEIPAIAASYQERIPYYHARHLIKPGVSGWAQLRHTDPPKFRAEVEKTKEKLSYDLYYIKNRSLLLDVKIALWTLRVLASRSGT